MAKLLLVFPGRKASRVRGWAPVRLPYSLLCLAGYVRPHGVDVSIHDLRLDDVRSADLDGVSWVGFSCMTGHQISSALDAAAYLRPRLPRAAFIWGGIHPSLHPEETARHPLVDVVVKGEGEDTLLDIVKTGPAGRDAAGLPGTVAIRNGAVVQGENRPFIDLDVAPLPAYDLIDLRRYPGGRSMLDYQTSRGCPFRCGFCYNAAFSCRKWRAKSAARVAADLEHLIRAHGVHGFSFVDDEIFIDRKRVEGILDRVLEAGLKFTWTASCRLDLCRKFSEALFGKLKASGCTQLYFGGESGSPAVLEAVSKDITTDDIMEGVRLCLKNEVTPIVSFMAGFPDETPEQFDATLDMITRIWAIDPTAGVNGIFPFSPYPGTALFDRTRAMGLRVPVRFEEWGTWTFKYRPDHPWLSARERERIRIAFYIVRFRYYLKEFGFRNRDRLARRFTVNALALPWRLSASWRWERRCFRFAWEWDLWAVVARKVFGFL